MTKKYKSIISNKIANKETLAAVEFLDIELISGD